MCPYNSVGISQPGEFKPGSFKGVWITPNEKKVLIYANNLS